MHMTQTVTCPKCTTQIPVDIDVQITTTEPHPDGHAVVAKLDGIVSKAGMQTINDHAAQCTGAVPS